MLEPNPPGADGRPASPTVPDTATPALHLPAEVAAAARRRRRDRVLGLVIVAVAFLLCLLLSAWARERSRPEKSQPPGPASAVGIGGFPEAVDALSSLPAARALTRRKLLRGIVMEGVRKNGTLDLSEASSSVRFAFQSPPGQGPQPHREPGTLPKRVTCGKQNVLLRQQGLVAEPDLADYPCVGLPLEALPEPQCSTKEIWRLARRHRVPKSRVARIEYYRAKAGPAWRFEIPGTAHRFTVYGDCKRELLGAEAHGSVP